MPACPGPFIRRRSPGVRPAAVPPDRSARGFALLAIVVFLALLATVYATGTVGLSREARSPGTRTAQALAAAREALIAYAATDDIRASGPAEQIRPGSLPCPDADGDGRLTVGADIVGSACKVYVGRIPWQRLGIPPPVDGSGEVLWYALTAQYRDAGTLEPDAGAHLAQGGLVHPDAPGALSITEQPGGALQPGLVAIVFAPGPALGAQARGGAGAFDPANYLDGPNGTTSTAFVAAAASGLFNDRLLAITREDLMAAGERRALGEVARALLAYRARHGYLPPPAAFGDAQCTQWTVSAGQCVAVDGVSAGRIPVTIAPPRMPWPDSTGSDPDRVFGASGAGHWFGGQRWRETVVYLVSPTCTQPATVCDPGGLSLATGAGAPVPAAFVLVAGGSAIAGQDRADALARGLLDNYLEGDARAAAGRMAAGGAPEPVVVGAGVRALSAPP